MAHPAHRAPARRGKDGGQVTGEMHSINQDGTDSNGDVWATHAAVAHAVGGTLEPFDAYQGPYIAVGHDLRVGQPPYAVPVRGLGMIRLWLVTDDGIEGRVYREDTDTQSESFWCQDEDGAAAAALTLLV